MNRAHAWRFCLVALLLTGLLHAADPAKMEAEGQALVNDLLSRRPAETSTNVGVLKLRLPKSKRSQMLVEQRIVVASNHWENIYTASQTNGQKICVLTITHATGQANQYALEYFDGTASKTLTGQAAMMSFAGTDFWLADLGLEFLHWPVQRLLKKEMRSSRTCSVLESIAPKDATEGYVRVVSWIDPKTGGIVDASAYDAKNKLLKEFEPKAFEKVNGQYELKSMEIRNVPADTRTTIVFDLDPK